MKEYTPDKIRNIGLVSHAGAGKTTLAEAMLFSSGEINRLGTIVDGTTTSDYKSDEIERQISISTSLIQCEWKNTKINVVDMPGYADFFGEVQGGLRAVDTAVILLSGISGVEVGTERAVRVAEKYGISRIFYINQLNKEHANFDNAVAMAQEQWGTSVAVLQFPVKQGEGFNAIIDLVRMKMFTFETDGSGKFSESDIPGDLTGKAEEMKASLMESVAENDESLLDVFCETGELTEEQFTNGLKKQIADGKLFPVLCGAASANIGVQSLMNFIANVLPSPVDKQGVTGVAPNSTTEVKRAPKDDEPFSALVYKTVQLSHVGEVSFFRIFSGKVEAGTDVLNSSKNNTEKIGNIYSMKGKERKEIEILHAGDIGAVVKLKNTETGDTLCARQNPIVLPQIEFPNPLYKVAISPKSKGDEDKMSSGLHNLRKEDPSFHLKIDQELHQVLLEGQSELHLNLIVKRLHEYGVEIETSEAKISYRETIRGNARESYRHKKQSGGAGQFGEVHFNIDPYREGAAIPEEFSGRNIELEDLPWGGKLEFVNSIVGGAIDARFVPAVKKGIMEVLESGAIAGYPITDIRIILYDGKMHPVDSNENAFKTAGRMCMRETFKKAKPVLLEPISEVTVIVPDEYMGDIMSDVSSSRGKILGSEGQGKNQVVKALIPEKEMARYSTKLRSMTQGRGIYTQKFSHYEEVPRDVADKIMAEAQEESEK
ncbi:elongation factor G [candidate division KSB1 bacterium]|nr:elongation factor G [candidate division KSB1 bacterium]